MTRVLSLFRQGLLNKVREYGKFMAATPGFKEKLKNIGREDFPEQYKEVSEQYLEILTGHTHNKSGQSDKQQYKRV
jgi:hypothetical protein